MVLTQDFEVILLRRMGVLAEQALLLQILVAQGIAI
jgi:hypothetical protein